MFKKIFKFIRRCFSFILTFIGGIWLISVIGMIAFLYFSEIKHKPLSEDSFIYVDLDKGFFEGEPNTLLSQIVNSESLPLYRLLETIEAASKDDKIKGIAASISEVEIGLAGAQEIRNAVLKFRKTGKKAIIFSESYGSLGSGTAEYYIASAFDEIWMQPTGELGITGLRVEIPFAKKALDKLGVKPSFFSFYEYKTAAAHFTDETFTKEHRESLTSLLQSIYDTVTGDIAEARNLDVLQVKNVIDTAPLLADEALKSGFIDKLAYRDELKNLIENEWHYKQINLVDYALNIMNSTYKDAPELAYINAVGTIVSDDGDLFPQTSKDTLSSKVISKAIRDAANDDKIKAIILRIDSPGGEYVASDTIWHEVSQAKIKKPVIASLSNYAASGGYFIAMNADKIVAQPSTITGSIGVLAGKLVPEELLAKLGINFEAISLGENAGFTSFSSDFSDSQKKRLNETLEFIYKDFTTKAMQARAISESEIDNIARGRVWSGEQALKLNLIDKIGGVPEAVAEAKAMINVAEDTPINLTVFPRPKTQAELIMDFLKNRPLVSLNSSFFKTSFENGYWSGVKVLEKMSQPNKVLMMPEFLLIN
ncbi:MAG: signal peptide peptidase SppA [Alphaproteobacteria bacterium]